jgi:oligopeptide/dipeptide ABC transporter, ATP-binding protein, C-terminal domain
VVTILEIKNLNVGYEGEYGTTRIINNFNLKIEEGIIFGIAGESGSGKSTLAQAIYNSLRYPGTIESGEVIFDGKDILTLSKKELRRMRAVDTAFIPQAAMNALNPVKRIGDQFNDVFEAHGKDIEESQSEIETVLNMVRLRPEVLHSYPHELSGGMKQRTVIAMALVLSPKLVILDEPTTGLDVLVEHDILRDIKRIQRQKGFTMLMITHDLSILYQISDWVAMVYAGEITEYGKREDMLNSPLHPYNYLLLKSLPRIGAERYEGIKLIGAPSNYSETNKGCQFITRCPFSENQCQMTHPELEMGYEDDHYYRCLRTPDWIPR